MWSINVPQLRIYFVILIIIFFAEMFVMYALSFFSFENDYIEIVLDSTLLTLIAAPFVYQLLINNLVRTNKRLVDELSQQVDSLNVAALVSETDIGGYITYVNDKFCEISGYTENEFLGKTHQLINSRTHKPEFWQDMWQTILAGNVWRGEVCNRRKDGSLYWVESTVFPKRNENNEISGFVSIRLDITEQKKTKQQLEQAVLKAEELTKAKSQFLATMSHEIRTPMNGVIAMAELLQKTPLDAEQHSMLTTIQSSGNNLLVIINDILDLSKIEAGKMQLNYHDFSLRRLVNELLFLYSSQTSQKNIVLEKSFSSAIDGSFVGDSTRINQILSNFMSNAIKFTEPKGKISFTLHSKDVDDTHTELRFSVKDSGIGITPEQQRKLFSDFTQADSSISRKYGGTGLGLSICTKLADLMDGAIDISSELGVGTEITLIITLKKAEQPVEDEQHIEQHSNNDKQCSVHYPHKILVADDNLINLKIAKMMLSNLGYECDIVSNGNEVIDACAKTPDYSIIFMDVMMPELDGIAATMALQQLLGEKCPPIIAMTANVFAEDQEKYKQIGMSGFVPKPFKLSDIKQALVENAGFKAH